jgi:hypothetical protein
MQHMVVSGTPVLYIGSKVLKGKIYHIISYKNRSLSSFWCTIGIPVVYITGVLLYTVF